jgi:hypothetical protein
MTPPSQENPLPFVDNQLLKGYRGRRREVEGKAVELQWRVGDVPPALGEGWERGEGWWKGRDRGGGGVKGDRGVKKRQWVVVEEQSGGWQREEWVV